MTGFLIVSLGFFVGVAGILYWENRRTRKSIAAAIEEMAAQEERVRLKAITGSYDWRDQVRMDVERYRRTQQRMDRVN